MAEPTPEIEEEPYRADPAGGEPSVIPDVSVAELETMLENIRWFSSLTLEQKLEASRRHRLWAIRVLAKQGVRAS